MAIYQSRRFMVATHIICNKLLYPVQLLQYVCALLSTRLNAATRNTKNWSKLTKADWRTDSLLCDPHITLHHLYISGVNDWWWLSALNNLGSGGCVLHLLLRQIWRHNDTFVPAGCDVIRALSSLHSNNHTKKVAHGISRSRVSSLFWPDIYSWPLAPPRTEHSYYGGGKSENYSVIAYDYICCELLHNSLGFGRKTGWCVGTKTRLLATRIRALYTLEPPSLSHPRLIGKLSPNC